MTLFEGRLFIREHYSHKFIAIKRQEEIVKVISIKFFNLIRYDIPLRLEVSFFGKLKIYFYAIDCRLFQDFSDQWRSRAIVINKQVLRTEHVTMIFDPWLKKIILVLLHH